MVRLNCSMSRLVATSMTCGSGLTASWSTPPLKSTMTIDRSSGWLFSASPQNSVLRNSVLPDPDVPPTRPCGPSRTRSTIIVVPGGRADGDGGARADRVPPQAHRVGRQRGALVEQVDEVDDAAGDALLVADRRAQAGDAPCRGLGDVGGDRRDDDVVEPRLVAALERAVVDARCRSAGWSASPRRPPATAARRP